MLTTALIFLALYMTIVFPHIETAYSGDHGENVSLIGNAIKQLIAQKVIWLGLIILGIRFYKIVFKKEEYEFWDNMILAALGYCVGCAILKLNWVLYYSSASILMLPAIAHYLNKYIDIKWASVVLACLALFMCRKMPDTIKKNQDDRRRTTAMMNMVKNNYNDGHEFYWFEPSDDRPWCFDLEQRRWLKESLQTIVGWEVGKENFKFKSVLEFTGNSGIYVLPSQNEKLFPCSNDSLSNKGKIIWGEQDENSMRFVIVDK